MDDRPLEELIDDALGLDAAGREFHELLHREYVRGCEEAERLPYDEKVKRLAELWAGYSTKVNSLFVWAQGSNKPDDPGCRE